ncbi:MAG: gamma carbonic anhydrase family protein [Acidobacteriota bacterium]
MPTYPYRQLLPNLGSRVFLAPSAEIVGDVEIGDDVSFWFHTLARGDVHWIRIGQGSNVQDGSVLHVSHETHPLDIGREVTVGHAAVVHGCTLEDRCLVGMGARVLDGAVIGEDAQVGAGAVVAPGTVVPARTLVLGVPAKPVRELSEEAVAANREVSARYRRLKEEYAQALGYGVQVAQEAS